MARIVYTIFFTVIRRQQGPLPRIFRFRLKHSICVLSIFKSQPHFDLDHENVKAPVVAGASPRFGECLSSIHDALDLHC